MTVQFVFVVVVVFVVGHQTKNHIMRAGTWARPYAMTLLGGRSMSITITITITTTTTTTIIDDLYFFQRSAVKINKDLFLQST